MAEAPSWQDLKKIPLFSELTENEIYQVMKLSFEKKYPKDSTLFIEGMAGEVRTVCQRAKLRQLQFAGHTVIAALAG